MNINNILPPLCIPVSSASSRCLSSIHLLNSANISGVAGSCPFPVPMEVTRLNVTPSSTSHRARTSAFCSIICSNACTAIAISSCARRNKSSASGASSAMLGTQTVWNKSHKSLDINNRSHGSTCCPDGLNTSSESRKAIVIAEMCAPCRTQTRLTRSLSAIFSVKYHRRMFRSNSPSRRHALLCPYKKVRLNSAQKVMEPEDPQLRRHGLTAGPVGPPHSTRTGQLAQGSSGPPHAPTDLPHPRSLSSVRET